MKHQRVHDHLDERLRAVFVRFRAWLHKILKITRHFLQLLCAFKWMFSKRYGFSSTACLVIFSRFILIRAITGKNLQSRGNGCRKSHVILSIFMQPGPGRFKLLIVFMWRHGGSHIGVWKQRNGGHIGVPNKLYFYVNIIFFTVNQHGWWSREWKRSTSLQGVNQVITNVR